MDGLIGKEFLKEYFKKSEPIISEYLNQQFELASELGKLPGQVIKDFENIVKGGKRLRGALTVLGYKAFGGKDFESIYDLSTFIELFHSGILVHDDLMDNDPFRRGVPTIHQLYAQKGKEDLQVKQELRRYGDSIAVCIGSGAFYMSWEKLLNGNFPAELKIKASSIYTKYTIRLLHGQELDVTITGATDIKEEDVLNVIWTKSGEYTSLLPLLVGATLAGADLASEKGLALQNYARCFGWAFHIQDDILGMFGDEEELGKPVGSDIREGKNTLFMLHLSQNGTPEQLDFKNSVLGNPDITKADVEKMRQTLRDAGSFDHVNNMGWNYVEEGKKYIPEITEDIELQKIFESLLVYMMERTK
jgi:geranylgeranyl diphosphate synthase type I